MLASLSFLLSLKQETLLIPRMFTVYTFMMDNEKRRVEEVEKKMKNNNEVEERNTNNLQHSSSSINRNWNAGLKIHEIQPGINVMADHQRNMGDGGATKSR